MGCGASAKGAETDPQDGSMWLLPDPEALDGLSHEIVAEAEDKLIKDWAIVENTTDFENKGDSKLWWHSLLGIGMLGPGRIDGDWPPAEIAALVGAEHWRKVERTNWDLSGADLYFDLPRCWLLWGGKVSGSPGRYWLKYIVRTARKNKESDEDCDASVFLWMGPWDPHEGTACTPQEFHRRCEAHVRGHQPLPSKRYLQEDYKIKDFSAESSHTKTWQEKKHGCNVHRASMDFGVHEEWAPNGGCQANLYPLGFRSETWRTRSMDVGKDPAGTMMLEVEIRVTSQAAWEMYKPVLTKIADSVLPNWFIRGPS